MKKSTLIFGITCLILSLVYLKNALNYSFGVMNEPGPAVFPIFAGGLLLVGSIGTLVQAAVKSPGEKCGWPRGVERVRVLAIVVAGLVYAFGVEFLGHILGSMIVILTCLHVMRMRSWPWKIATSLLVSIVSYVLFHTLLSTSLPRGILESLIYEFF